VQPRRAVPQEALGPLADVSLSQADLAGRGGIALPVGQQEHGHRPLGQAMRGLGRSQPAQQLFTSGIIHPNDQRGPSPLHGKLLLPVTCKIGLGPLVTVVDPATQKTELVSLPTHFDAAASKPLWKPLFDQLHERMRRRGLENAMMIGIVQIAAAAMVRPNSCVYRPWKIMMPIGRVLIAMSFVMISGQAKSVHEPMKVKIASAARAGFTSGRMIRQ
jgi:hypothetical protein